MSKIKTEWVWLYYICKEHGLVIPDCEDKCPKCGGDLQSRAHVQENLKEFI